MIQFLYNNIYKRLNEVESINIIFNDGTSYVYDRPTNELCINHNHMVKIPNMNIQNFMDNNNDKIVFISIVEDGKQTFKLDLRD